ncbi:MAG TPA: methylenetetrahydrofolate reductase [NAD(P)H] [Balneola sp.]|jgi:methylenetetrahydrofolate reductase (NADPH)|nr:methylenetetrahydrofolate reductase [NAD(P)H] [Balneola sp.]MAO78025.1 methylenetetrahydrofolate reductase [NAD(P)H] [Balneola sp.]MBF64026.1 methylenetetrahydrofolate reductase [NAD(P)H] [Balneola sp.]HBZ37773.1 methylenetetrahydrofolate reductase [NAD(P)H] [Balneola sp.]|tara:strand:+ start:1491 stop:2447 length:957 start_codon:yes stop_codon:yes gene_type:complete
MKITEYIKQAKGKALFSFEVLPPLKGQNIQTLFDHIDPLMEFKPPFIDVTYHREEYIYKKRENGLLERKTVRKRPGTVGMCAAIQNHYKVDAVPHIICGGFTKEETENALIDLNFLGIDNVLVLQGDVRKPDRQFIPEPDGHSYASELLAQVVDLNKGIYLDGEIENAMPSDFCIGVAGYPEKHETAPNMESDLRYLKKKVDGGADYIVTQMFFDNQKYFDFVNRCREKGITIPIIPGIKPVTTLKQITLLPQLFNIDLPEALTQELEKCTNNEAAREVGREWTIQQTKELVEFGVPSVHFYSMGKSTSVYEVAKEIF